MTQFILQTLKGVNFTSAVILDGITNIGKQAFYDRTGFTHVIIPASVTSIDSYAFYNCSGLNSVTIPASVTSIGSHAFYTCTGLNGIYISEGVKTIGSEAFYGCSGLTSVTIPASVTNIYSKAFKSCSIKSVTVKRSTLPLTILQDGDEFGTTSSLLSIIESIYVPSSVVSLYQTDTNYRWTGYASKIKAIP